MSVTINASTSAGAVITSDTSGSLQLQTNSGTTAVTVDTSQNVGVGTTSPTAKLHTQIGAGATAGLKALNANGGGLQFYTDTTGANADVFIESPKTGVALAFLNGGSERMRIDSSGNLLVAKNSYTVYSNGFQVGPNDNGTNIPNVSITGNASNSASTALQLYSTSGSAFKFYVNYAGTISAANGTINVISDQRLKENIRDLPDGLDSVMALKPRLYDWKEGKGANIKNARGFIAQEFETVFPDLIDEWKDPAPEGEEPYKSVRADLIPVLVKAIQELKAELDATKAEVAALKGTV